MTIIRMLMECFYGGYDAISQDTMKRKYPEDLIHKALDCGYMTTHISNNGIPQFVITRKGKELI